MKQRAVKQVHSQEFVLVGLIQGSGGAAPGDFYNFSTKLTHF